MLCVGCKAADEPIEKLERKKELRIDTSIDSLSIFVTVDMLETRGDAFRVAVVPRLLRTAA
jgi:hypothetical protein